MARPADGSTGSTGRSLAWLLAVALVFAGIVASYRDFVPYWDALGYLGCVTDAAQKPFDLLNFRCVGHPSVVYLLLLGVPQYLAPWRLEFVYGTNALLGVASIAAFHALLRLLFPERRAAEYALVTALYAFAPLFVVHAIFMNLDYGMTAFFVLFLYFLVARRFWLANVFAIAMMFSKEVGAAAYVMTVLAYVIAFTLRPPMTRQERVAALRLHAPLLVAPLVLAAYVVDFQMLRADAGSLLSAYAPVGIIHDPWGVIFNINPADPGVRSFLADIFVLNFQWVYTALVIAALGASAWRGAPGSRAPSAVPGCGLFLSLVLVQLVYAVTRYRDYNNARYVLITVPVLVALFYRALVSIVSRGRARRLVLGIAAALVLFSNFRTIDFGSKAVFGTFAFGSHALLDMPSLLGGPRMDSLVYNLESLEFHYLLNDLMQDVRPAPQTVFLMGDTTYNFPLRVDARTYTRTVDPSPALPLIVLSLDGDVQKDALRRHLAADDSRFFYVAFANADNHQLRLLKGLYPLVSTKQYERSGYTLDLYTFQFTAPP